MILTLTRIRGNSPSWFALGWGFSTCSFVPSNTDHYRWCSKNAFTVVEMIPVTHRDGKSLPTFADCAEQLCNSSRLLRVCHPDYASSCAYSLYSVTNPACGKPFIVSLYWQRCTLIVNGRCSRLFCIKHGRPDFRWLPFATVVIVSSVELDAAASNTTH